MKYYLHDSNAFSDEKITMLFMKYGYEGLGLFYTALEKLAAQEKPINTDVLKAQLKIGKRLEKIFKYCEDLGILSSNNGETFSKQLLNFAGKYAIKKEKNREKVSQWREKQEDIKTVTGYVPKCNADKVNKSKVKESKEKEIEERKSDKPTTPTFDFSISLIEYGAYSDLVRDWMTVRKKLKAVNTETAFKLFITQVEKSKRNINDVLKKCIEKSWKGFDASWDFGDGKLHVDKDIFIQDDDADKYVKMINSLSITDWQREMKKFVINTEAKMLFCPNLKRFVPWKMIEGCQRLYDHAKVEFASKALGDTYMTPATYGRVR